MHARIASTFALVLLALCATAQAQQKPSTATQKPAVTQQQPATQQPAPAAEAKPAANANDAATANPVLDREVASMREKVTDGKTFRSHVRVTVRLKNGNRVQGIVKDGFVVERIDGMRFVSAEANDDGAGVRIYTYNGKRNYVFLAFSDMAEYRINARLSTAELAAYERKVKSDEEQKRKALLKQLGQEEVPQETPAVAETAPMEPAAETAEPATKAKAKPGKQGATAEGEDKQGVGQELQQMYSLLQQYPPAQGWNAVRRDEIARRFAVVGARPSAAEQKFVDQFDAWKRACEVLGANAAPQGETAPQGENESGKKSKKSRR